MHVSCSACVHDACDNGCMTNTDRPKVGEEVVCKVGHDTYVSGTITTNVDAEGYVHVEWDDGDVGDCDVAHMTWNGAHWTW